MLKRRFHNFAALALTLSVTPLLIGCGDDDPTGGGGASAFVGSWNATTFVVDGTDIVAGGTTISFSFTENTYTFAVTGDTNSVLCDSGVTSCGEGGDLGSTATSIIFDPGSSDEVTFTFNVSGDVLTVSGTIEGSTVTATFQKL